MAMETETETETETTTSDVSGERFARRVLRGTKCVRGDHCRCPPDDRLLRQKDAGPARRLSPAAGGALSACAQPFPGQGGGRLLNGPGLQRGFRNGKSGA